MEAQQGYIKVYRKLMNSAVFSDPELLKLWMLCLMKASYKPRWESVEGMKAPVRIEPGQFITGRFALHRDYYPKKKKNQKSPLTIWRWLEILENMGNLNIRTNKKFSIVTIVNWDTYQGEDFRNEQQDEHLAINWRSTDDQLTITNKKDKKDKKDKKEDFNGGLHPHRPDQAPEAAASGGEAGGWEARPKGADPCPHQEIIGLYHEILPELAAVRVWNDAQRAQLRARWREDRERQGLEWWRTFFEWVRESPFLMGRKRDWQADLEWLVRKSNFAKVLNGRYHRESGAGSRCSEKTRRTMENLQEWMQEEAGREGPKTFQ